MNNNIGGIPDFQDSDNSNFEFELRKLINDDKVKTIIDKIHKRIDAKIRFDRMFYFEPKFSEN